MSKLWLTFRTLQPSIAFSWPWSTTIRKMTSPSSATEYQPTPESPLEGPISVDPNRPPKNPISRSTERVMSNAPKQAPEEGLNTDLGVGEIEGGRFKIEPLRRTGEDQNTMRARLVYQSRKRGTLESDLLMSTFADTYLQDMTMDQMRQYDLFLDENDWDIYYWATQEPMPTSGETAEGSGSRQAAATLNAEGENLGSPGTEFGKRTSPVPGTDSWHQDRVSGEWAQTVGTFKPAYRPVPTRWKNSEILTMLRHHVLERSAAGIREGRVGMSDEALSKGSRGTMGGGMAFMPQVRNMDK